MKVMVVENIDRLAVAAADLVQDFVCSTPTPVLGLATGASVQPLYSELVRRHREESLSFATVRAFLLDEYVGLDPDHPQLYRNLIRTELTGRVDIDPANLHSPDANAPDLEEQCSRYDRRIRRARIELQILGVGRNGHLAFNEPGARFDSRTRVVHLTSETRADNARFFDRPDNVPRKAVTQGLGTILQAGHLLVIAVGSPKAAAVRGAVSGPVSRMLPASILQTHPRATLMLDPDAAGASIG